MLERLPRFGESFDNYADYWPSESCLRFRQKRLGRDTPYILDPTMAARRANAIQRLIGLAVGELTVAA